MENIILYHGSKEGIIGDIQPIGRSVSDFGQGFYMGTKREQAELLVLDEPSPIIYTLRPHLIRIPQEQILTFSDTLEWALFVLYNRNMLEDYDNIEQSALYEKLANMGKNKEFIIGPIADDNMTMLMQQFVDETITDKVFIECIKCIDLGDQYVAKTESACKQIDIIEEEKLSLEKQNIYRKSESERRRNKNRTLKQTRKQYKGEGLYLSDIIKKYDKLAKQIKLAEGIDSSISKSSNSITIQYGS